MVCIATYTATGSRISLSFGFWYSLILLSFDWSREISVISQRVHLFPFRTQKLSSVEATILAWRRAGKIVKRWYRLIEASFYLHLNSKQVLSLSSFLTKTLKSPRITDEVGVISQRVHLFPFRTQKLSSAEATILAWRRAGKIAQCQHHPIQLTADRG